jgi:hypothetical protein
MHLLRGYFLAHKISNKPNNFRMITKETPSLPIMDIISDRQEEGETPTSRAFFDSKGDDICLGLHLAIFYCNLRLV